MRAIIRLAAVAGFVLAATTAMAQTVKIGLLAPFSGPFAIWGSQFKQAVEAFQKVHGDSVKGARRPILTVCAIAVVAARTKPAAAANLMIAFMFPLPPACFPRLQY